MVIIEIPYIQSQGQGELQYVLQSLLKAMILGVEHFFLLPLLRAREDRSWEWKFEPQFV